MESKNQADSIPCANCKFREKYDNNPKSFLGRLWKFHTKFCPGWKAYLKTLDAAELAKLKEKYSFLK